MTTPTALAGRLPRLTGTFRLLNVLLLLAVAGLAVAAYLAVRAAPRPAAASIRTGTVARGVVLSTVSATGSIVAPQNLTLGFQTSGRVAELDVKEGEQVARGQMLARLDATAAREALAVAEANLQTAQANLATTLAGETPSQRTQDDVSLQQAKAQVRSAQVAVAQARTTSTQDARAASMSVAQAQAQLAQDRSAQTLSVAAAERQLHVDLGNETGYAGKVASDKTTVENDQAAYNSATAAVNNDNGRIATDNSQIESLNEQRDSQTSDQTADQQQLAADEASLTAAETKGSQSSINHWKAVVAGDQARVNDDAQSLNGTSAALTKAQYQLSLDQAALAADEKTQSTADSTLSTDKATLTSDQATVVSYETKVAADRQALAAARQTQAGALAKDAQAVATARQQQRATQTKDGQSVATARQQVSSARLSEKATAASNGVKQAAPTANTIAQLEGAVKQARTTLADAERTLAETALRAPVAGTVAAVSAVLGQQVSAAGDTATSSSSSSSSSSNSSSSGVLSLVGVSAMEASAPFAESDAAKIKVGDAATVTIPALANAELAAHVVSVDEESTSSSGVVEYTVTVALDRSDNRLKPGMTGNVSVVTAERDGVLHVPSGAVHGSGANATVTVVGANGVQHTARVVAGLQGDTATEIVSGLKAGQTVVTSTGTSALSNAAANAAQLGKALSTGRGRLGGGGARVFFGGP